jgi:hypothetical protein
MALDPSILFSIYSESKDKIFSNIICGNQKLFFSEVTVKRMFDSGNTENRGDFKIYSLTELFELQKKKFQNYSRSNGCFCNCSKVKCFKYIQFLNFASLVYAREAYITLNNYNYEYPRLS